MNEVEYIIDLGPEGEDRYRHYHRTEGKQVLEFRVQYEAFIRGEWYAVVRYDTAHGYAHRDILHPTEPENKTILVEREYAAALTVAERDLKTNWKKYRQLFELELRS